MLGANSKPAAGMALLFAVGLSACGGNFSGAAETGGGSGSGGNVSGGNSGNVRDFFAARVEPNLGFCRTCHVPGGVADTAGTSAATQGKLFLLSSDSGQDYANVLKAWNALGNGVTSNKLLTNPSDPAQNHTGGQPWPSGSQAYAAMRIVLGCWDNPANCASLLNGGGGTPVAQAQPLLGSSHARSFMDSYCANNGSPLPDSAVLPQDPRQLIRPGVDAGKAVAYNAWWQDCTGPAGNPRHRPLTCGDYRSRASAGEKLLRGGQGMDLAFEGKGLIPSTDYNAMWTRWGDSYASRPADFDREVQQRYGLPAAPFNNPYPLPGEDPNQSSGGSGQLPVGLVQVKAADGSYTGSIGVTCDACHSGSIDALAASGGAFVSGMGANTADLQLLLTDAAAPLPIGLNDSRGVTNAEGLSGLLIGLLNPDSLGLAPQNSLFLQLPGNTSGGGDTKMPPWWNASHRPRKFWDGGMSYDGARLASAILNALTPAQSPTGLDQAFNRNLRDTIENQSLEIEAYIESLRAPAWPYGYCANADGSPGPGDHPACVNTPLAEQGAVLFHSKNLWAAGLNNPVPRPATGNGSCAGCHGAYSPRYVNDPGYLADPRLEGIAGYIAPLEVIQTDPARSRGFTPMLLDMMSTSWFSYPEGSPGYVSPDQENAVQLEAQDLEVLTPGQRVKGACTWEGDLPTDALGYLAPPLYGIWATAPYLHNGSLPDVWSVLSPSSRPAMWRRQLTGGNTLEHGFDTGGGAYDAAKLGWKYEAMDCGDTGGIPYLSCQPQAASPAVTALIDFINQVPGNLDSLGYQVTPPLLPALVDARKVFNTSQFAKSNGGHAFTRVLTDQERRAIIEYLKTL